MEVMLLLFIIAVGYVAIKILLWWADYSEYHKKPKNDSQEEWERKRKTPDY